MLYFVATPIGNLNDISIRAVQTLRAAECILAEDTRVARVLCARHAVKTPLVSYHDHNKHGRIRKILPWLKKGKEIAFIANAGTPLISDPGYTLLKRCLAENIPFTSVPGPAAPINALLLSGLAPDRFFFCGFLPLRKSRRKSLLEQCATIPATLIFFESCHRLKETLLELSSVFPSKPAAFVREMTKIYEEIQRARIEDLAARVKSKPKGEYVVLIDNR